MTSTVRRIAWPFVAAMLVSALTIIAVFFIVGRAVHQADQRDLHRMQDALCGLVVPIGHASPQDAKSALGHTIIVAAGHSSKVIHCPR